MSKTSRKTNPSKRASTASLAAADVGDGPGAPAPSALLRRLVSVALLAHLTAVVAPPLNFATGGNGATRWLYETFRPYSQAAYLDHGYFFFAPDPGASHLVRYRAEFADDRKPVEDMFPDKHKQWPRLLYHRHFMLTEHLHAAFAPPEPPPDLTDEGRRQWRDARDLYEARWNDFVEHLSAAHGASSVTMTRVEHRPPDPQEFLDGTALDAEELFADLPEQLEPETTRPTGQGGAPSPNGPLGPAPLRPGLGPAAPLGPLRPGAIRGYEPRDAAPPSLESIPPAEEAAP